MQGGDEKRSPFFILFLVVLIDMIGFTLVIPFLTYFIQDLATGRGIVEIGARDRWVGLTMAAYTLGQFIFTPILGSLSDQHGRRPILLFGLVSNTIFLLAFGLTGNLWIALLVRFLAGAGNGNIAVARAYVGDVSETHQLTGRMGLLGAAFGIGFMIGPMIGGLLSDPAAAFGGVFDSDYWRSHPYLLPCVFASLLSAISLIFALKYLPESLPKEKRTRGEPSAIASLKKVSSNLIGVRDLAHSVKLLILVNAIFMLAFTMMQTTFILFTGMEIVQGGMGYDARDNGYVFAFIGFMGVLIQGGLIGPLSRKFGNKKLMSIGIIFAAVGLSSIPYLRPEPFILVFAVMSFVAIANGLFQPSLSTLTTVEAKMNSLDLGRVMGSQAGFGALARVIGPVLAAFIWEATVNGTGVFSYHTVFRICGILSVIAFIVQLRFQITTPIPPISSNDKANAQNG
ncbi:MAG: MFS transporter [Euryarchaeota archaeon]|nr:MFS transporter [Euryarchaeota archaeon]MBT6645323.1 MFS transporter [Euryarchaeota archaeon]